MPQQRLQAAQGRRGRSGPAGGARHGGWGPQQRGPARRQRRRRPLWGRGFGALSGVESVALRDGMKANGWGFLQPGRGRGAPATRARGGGRGGRMVPAFGTGRPCGAPAAGAGGAPVMRPAPPAAPRRARRARRARQGRRPLWARLAAGRRARAGRRAGRRGGGRTKSADSAAAKAAHGPSAGVRQAGPWRALCARRGPAEAVAAVAQRQLGRARGGAH